MNYRKPKKPKRPYWALALLLVAACRPAAPVGPGGIQLSPRGGCAVRADYTDAQLLALAMDRVHRHCQPPGPLGVVVDPDLDPRLCGQTEKMGPGWFIRLSPSAHGDFLLEVLAHEVAHALAWPTAAEMADPDSCGGHTEAWALARRKAYLAIWFDYSTPARPAQPDPCGPQPEKQE